MTRNAKEDYIGGNLALNLIAGVVLGAVVLAVISLMIASRRQEMRDKRKEVSP